MTRQELEAENARLTGENEALRDLLAAVRELATVPEAADWRAVPYTCNLEARLSRLAACARPLDDVSPRILAGVIRDRASALREMAAEPVRYEVKAAHAPAVIEPCGCSHGGHLHDSGGCMLQSCGCAKFRPGAAVTAPEPPAVAAGEVVVASHSEPLREAAVGEPECGAVDGGYTCTARAGHDGPRHVAHNGHGHVVRRWPVTASLRIGGNLLPLRGES